MHLVDMVRYQLDLLAYWFRQPAHAPYLVVMLVVAVWLYFYGAHLAERGGEG